MTHDELRFIFQTHERRIFLRAVFHPFLLIGKHLHCLGSFFVNTVVDGSQRDTGEGGYQRVIKSADRIIAGYRISQLFQGVNDANGDKVVGAHKGSNVAGNTAGTEMVRSSGQLGQDFG